MLVYGRNLFRRTENLTANHVREVTRPEVLLESTDERAKSDRLLRELLGMVWVRTRMHGPCCEWRSGAQPPGCFAGMPWPKCECPPREAALMVGQVVLVAGAGFEHCFLRPLREHNNAPRPGLRLHT